MKIKLTSKACQKERIVRFVIGMLCVKCMNSEHSKFMRFTRNIPMNTRARSTFGQTAYLFTHSSTPFLSPSFPHLSPHSYARCCALLHFVWHILC